MAMACPRGGHGRDLSAAHTPEARGSPGSAAHTRAQADMLHPTTAPCGLHPISSSHHLKVSLFPQRLGSALPPAPVREALPGKQAPSPVPLSLLAALAIADDESTAVGAKAVDVNMLHVQPCLAMAWLHAGGQAAVL